MLNMPPEWILIEQYNSPELDTDADSQPIKVLINKTCNFSSIWSTSLAFGKLS